MQEDFLLVVDHFKALVETMPPKQLALYKEPERYVRIETGFKGRHFVVYKVRGTDPVELDRITVEDFHCTDEEGSSMIIKSAETGKSLIVGYTPLQVLDFPLFMFMPLHAKIRWGTTPGRVGKGSLGFPLAIQGPHRINLRTPGPVFCETGPVYAEVFNLNAVA